MENVWCRAALQTAGELREIEDQELSWEQCEQAVDPLRVLIDGVVWHKMAHPSQLPGPCCRRRRGPHASMHS